MINNNAKKLLKVGVLSAFFIFIIVYAFFRSQDLIFGVKIRNVMIAGASAHSGQKYNDSLLQMNGVARNAIKLSLNGREIPVDQAGNFSETIALLPGYNIINIRAEDKFGDVDEKNYQLVRE